MTIYYSESTKGFYLSEINGNNLPQDCVEISKDKYKELLKGQSENKQIISDSAGNPTLVDHKTEHTSTYERCWRDSELVRADIEIYKVQDSDPEAVGTVAGWREYRKALRAWPEHRDFPNKEKRPVAPDAPKEPTVGE